MGMSPAGVSSVQEVQQPACVGGVLRALLCGSGRVLTVGGSKSSSIACGSSGENGQWLCRSDRDPGWQLLEGGMKTVIKLPFRIGVPF